MEKSLPYLKIIARGLDGILVLVIIIQLALFLNHVYHGALDKAFLALSLAIWQIMFLMVSSIRKKDQELIDKLFKMNDDLMERSVNWVSQMTKENLELRYELADAKEKLAKSEKPKRRKSKSATNENN